MDSLKKWALDLLIGLLSPILVFLACFLLSVVLVLLAVWAGLAVYVWLFIRRLPIPHRKIAVFGKTGSGKTMLLTTFYGHQQAAGFRHANGFSLTAKDAGQGEGLLAAYYRLENDLVPPGNRFQYTTYDFDFRIRDIQKSVGLVSWYDYPGGWWSEDKAGDEQRRKAELISRLVHSDVALFLVDGLEFKRKGGNYLRCLFAQFRDELTRQRSALSPSARRKVRRYPSIWVICLSKADLFDGYTVEEFRKQVLKHAEDEIRCLRDDVRSMVKNPDLVSIGEEFLLLSSAEFDPESQHIKNPTKTIGIDLVVAISMLAPVRHAGRLVQLRQRRAGGLKRILVAMQSLTFGWMKYLPVVGNTFMFLDDSMNKMVRELEGLEVATAEKGGVLESVVHELELRLASNDAQRVYVGVDTRRV